MSPIFETVALPQWPVGGADPTTVRSAIDRWVRSDAVAGLVRCFGGTAPSGTADEALAQLVAFSAAWDYRGGALERGEIQVLEYSQEIGEIVNAAVLALGLSGRERPSSTRYDHVLVLGGGARSALARPDFAARLLRGGVEAPAVSALSSLRKLEDPEIGLAASFGMPGIAFEADTMAAGMVRAFAADAAPVRREGATGEGEPWWTLTYTASGRTLSVIAAASTTPGRRANTADTLTGWAELVHTPAGTDRLLVVTTDLFVPFQHADSVRLLGLRYGCGVETVGLATDDYTRWLRPNTHTALLQEVRSSILAMNRLAEACLEPSAR
ncbi:hypothetical protein OHA72_28540 [Dactylosporangium sp. NBC_01737]|uniref:hypothetical protein n=1 Tax=Dactylosporangium sp. NBC_01737 TaxID=2975959 RepID=UPI002E0D3886|nr:hypothetical protein OHA72_28540 [Dactylosporangium sp. NBC_01737]